MALIRWFLTRRTDGYALLTVMVFVLILLIAGTGYFALASFETKGALYRQKSSEAFYLADGAVERARAEFLLDRTWRDGWTAQPGTGRGTYDLTVEDATYPGFDNVVRLLATGHVLGADRRVEVYAQVPPTGTDLPILVMGDADIGGQLCVNGSAHFNHPLGPSASHFSCGTYTDSFPIYPPPIYTDPGHFPNSTYYFVRATTVAGVPQARMFAADGVTDITPSPNPFETITSWNNSDNTYIFNFDRPARITTFFDESNPAAVFRRNAGTIAVVVNFGEPPLDPPNSYCTVVFDGDAYSDVHATIINTRFLGTTEEERIDYRYWAGDSTRAVPEIQLRQVTFEPFNGIAFICYNLNRTGSALCYVGTTTWPALVYTCHDVNTINSNFNLHGSLICLHDYHSTGNPTFTYDGGFIDNLPDYLRDDWPDGVSGTLKVLRWREIAAN